MRSVRFGVIALVALLAGCQSNGGRVPVMNAGETGRAGANIYIVQRGDTLYSIAFRFGLDYKALAANNRIEPPYTIFVNQRISVATTASAAADKRPSPPAKVAGRSKNSNNTKNPVASTRPSQPIPPPIKAPQADDSNIKWRWPTDGTVVGPFSLTGKINKGIDIKGKSGEGVRATADGVVVYAGGGLRGYGKLIILKHNERFLSAYGHNESLLVKEGDSVKAGQVVAKVGGTNGDADLLHFEIRRDGKPEDPMGYLPPRKQDS